MRRIFIISILGLLANLNFCFSQDTLSLVIQPGPVEGKDARVKETDPNFNESDLNDMVCNTWTNSGTWRIVRNFFEFDLSAVPTNATLISANLSLYHIGDADGSPGSLPTKHNNSGGSIPNAGWIHRVVESWEEDQITWNNQPAISELNKVEIPTTTSPFQSFPDLDVTAVIQDMLIDPANSHGFRLSLQNESYTYKGLVFGSSDHADPDLRPKLDIIYSIDTTQTLPPPPPILPEPEPVFIKVFPNPAKDWVTIWLSSYGNLPVELEIFSSSRQLVFKEVLENSILKTLDLSHLERGVYFFHFQSGALVDIFKVVVL